MRPSKLPVARHVVNITKGGRPFGPQHRLHLLRSPNIELPFLAFAVGVLGAVEPAKRVGHVAEHVVERLADDAEVVFPLGLLPGVEITAGQHGIVVQHFLEVRHEPLGIDAIAMESAAEMVVDAACRHVIERDDDHLQQRFVPRSPPASQQEVEVRGVGKLGRGAETAQAVVEGLGQIGFGRFQRGLVQLGRLVAHEVRGLEKLHGLFRLLEDVAAALAPRGGHGREHVAEARHSAPPARRPVRAAEERLLFGREEDRHRPSALAGHRLHRLHVDLVQVRPLFAIDLDTDEIAVQAFRDRGVLETLVGHHVAPVAGRIADREKDRLLLRAGTQKRFRAPRLPIDGVLGVL